MFKTLKSLVAGIAAGTALGILFAPKKGDETRQSLKKEVKSGGTGLKTIKELMTDMGKEIGDTAKEVYTEAQKEAQRAKPKVKKTIKRVELKAKSTLKKAKKTLSK